MSSGKVDVDLMSLLAALCRRHTVDVSSFRGDPAGAKAEAPERVAAITAIDGRRLPRMVTGRWTAGLSTLPAGSFQAEMGRDQGRPVLLVRPLFPSGT
jgi:hypothetical protein